MYVYIRIYITVLTMGKRRQTAVSQSSRPVTTSSQYSDMTAMSGSTIYLHDDKFVKKLPFDVRRQLIRTMKHKWDEVMCVCLCVCVCMCVCVRLCVCVCMFFFFSHTLSPSLVHRYNREFQRACALSLARACVRSLSFTHSSSLSYRSTSSTNC